MTAGGSQPVTVGAGGMQHPKNGGFFSLHRTSLFQLGAIDLLWPVVEPQRWVCVGTSGCQLLPTLPRKKVRKGEKNIYLLFWRITCHANTFCLARVRLRVCWPHSIEKLHQLYDFFFSLPGWRRIWQWNAVSIVRLLETFIPHGSQLAPCGGRGAWCWDNAVFSIVITSVI